ncbi:MAG: sn-glycerol-3-phosphate ABC transporter permease UgpA [Burkholderiaceae bacterium]
MEKRVRFPGTRLPWLLLGPQFAVIAIFFYWPAVQAVYQSIFVQDAFGLSREFVGLENFRVVLADPDYVNSLQVSAWFAVLVTTIGLSASLVLAYFADRAIRTAMLFRTLLIWPYAVAPAIAGVLWMFLFNPSIGIITWWLSKIGIDWNHLLHSGQAMTLIVIAAVWKQISYNFIFFLAGLQSIPRSMIEAAAIDGAGNWRTFRSIIVPLLSPTLFFLLVVNVVYAFFETFAIIDAVTSGGPGNSTEILVYKVYADGFKGLDIGGSAAQSVILMLIVIALTFIQFRFVERKVQYV